MIKKPIKYYKRKNSFICNITLTKKDIQTLNITFKENSTNKSKQSIQDYLILSDKEYNQMNIHNDKVISDKKELEELKETNNNLNQQLETITPKYNKLTNELTTEKEISNKQKKEIHEIQDQHKNEIKEINDKYLKIIQDIQNQNKNEIHEIQDQQLTEIKKYSNEKIKLNNEINLYKFLVLGYEKEIKDFNKRNFISKIFHHSLKLQNKESLKQKKSIEYIPKKQD